MLYPMLMAPVFKQFLWGGEQLKTAYGKDIPGNPTAESWEVACHENGTSAVANGRYQGKLLSEVVEQLGSDLLGDNIDKQGKFPLLLKLLDAQDRLSVQVHPNDAYANAYENGELGKTEMWVVLDAKPGAKLVYGFRPNVTKQAFAQAIQDGTVEQILHTVAVQPGDVFYLPAGLVHAIGAGIVIAELQQNSDTTYRVFDYNRVGADGKTRELHVEKALAVSDLSCMEGNEKSVGYAVNDGENTTTYLVCCPHFAMERLEVAQRMAVDTHGSRMHLLFVAEGSGGICYQGGKQPFRAGQSFVIPAGLGGYEIVGQSTVLKGYVPDLQKDVVLPLSANGATASDFSRISGLSVDGERVSYS